MSTERPMRRLSDKVLAAFDQACDGGMVDAADHLLRALEIILTQEGGAKSSDSRGDLGAVQGAYDRLAELKRR